MTDNNQLPCPVSMIEEHSRTLGRIESKCDTIIANDAAAVARHNQLSRRVNILEKFKTKAVFLFYILTLGIPWLIEAYWPGGPKR